MFLIPRECLSGGDGFTEVLPVMARDRVAFLAGVERGFLAFADIGGKGAAGVEFAPRWLIGGRGDFAFELLRLAAIIGIQ